MFNAVVRLCIRDLLPCLLRTLNLVNKKENKAGDAKTKPVSSGNNWKKLKAPVKSYLTDMIAVSNNYKYSFLRSKKS